MTDAFLTTEKTNK